MAAFSHRCLLAALAATAVICSVNLVPAASAQVAGSAPDRSTRELLVGHDSMQNERIETIDRGQVQLLFTDQSSLSIAPDSDVVINEFRYDPEAQTGNLTVTVTAGLLRYVGGGISRKTDVMFYTPTAAVSVRGGIVVINAARDGRAGQRGGKTEVFFLSGDRLCVTANEQRQCTTKFDTAITSEKGEPPLAPVAVTAEAIQALFSNLLVADGRAPSEIRAPEAGQTTPASDAVIYEISKKPR